MILKKSIQYYFAPALFMVLGQGCMFTLLLIFDYGHREFDSMLIHRVLLFMQWISIVEVATQNLAIYKDRKLGAVSWLCVGALIVLFCMALGAMVGGRISFVDRQAISLDLMAILLIGLFYLLRVVESYFRGWILMELNVKASYFVLFLQNFTRWIVPVLLIMAVMGVNEFNFLDVLLVSCFATLVVNIVFVVVFYNRYRTPLIMQETSETTVLGSARLTALILIPLFGLLAFQFERLFVASPSALPYLKAHNYLFLIVMAGMPLIHHYQKVTAVNGNVVSLLDRRLRLAVPVGFAVVSLGLLLVYKVVDFAELSWWVFWLVGLGYTVNLFAHIPYINLMASGSYKRIAVINFVCFIVCLPSLALVDYPLGLVFFCCAILQLILLTFYAEKEVY